MRSFGFTPEELKSIKNLFQKHFGDLPDAKIYLFGSRSKGTHKKYSDVDLAVKTKAKEISKRIALFKASWEETKIPYKVDITSWKDIYKPYLQDIRKTKKIIWTPEDKELHPWRVCPYGEHWVVRHPRYPVGRQIQDVDGHCRKNPSGKDRLKGDEIELISRISFSLSLHKMISRIPDRLAARIFSLIPPTGNTLPRKVISPVMASLFFTLRCVNAEASDVSMEMPADGPSFGVAPSGTWICTFH